jgi:hypothetical protein
LNDLLQAGPMGLLGGAADRVDDGIDVVAIPQSVEGGKRRAETQLAGGFGLPAALPLSARIEESFTRRLARLPVDARRLLLVAAADPVGDLALVWRAAQRLGIAESAAQTVESDGLVAFGAGVVFRHPLARSAVYRAALADGRSEAHRALAEATDPDLDPDRRAWHRAQAATMPDEEVAAELERSAARAQARGGLAAAAAFLERSSVLTLDPARRAGRALAAAQATQQAGALDEALTLAESAEAGPLDEFQRAQVDVLRARTSSPPIVAARRLACCSRRPSDWSRWTCSWRVSSTSTR